MARYSPSQAYWYRRHRQGQGAGRNQIAPSVGSSWSLQAGWTADASARLIATTAALNTAASRSLLTTGRKYRVAFTVDSISGIFALYAGTTGGGASGALTTIGAKSFDLIADGNALVFRAESAGASFQISALSILEIDR